MKKIFTVAFDYFLKITDFFSNFLLLAMRLWVANIFWNSGMVKIADWGNTLALFREEYQVPVIPPEIAAVFAAGFEISCPILLTVGLASRFAVLPLLAMTAVIQFTYLQHEQHYYWAFLLFTIMCFGAGKISLDYLIQHKFIKCLYK